MPPSEAMPKKKIRPIATEALGVLAIDATTIPSAYMAANVATSTSLTGDPGVTASQRRILALR